MRDVTSVGERRVGEIDDEREESDGMIDMSRLSDQSIWFVRLGVD